ncbi:MAG: DUF3788 family protein [Acidobacteria bacterium]|nr:DUF3788 family protein [Acidobacteriota bacterium]
MAEEALFTLIGSHRAQWKNLLAGIAQRFPEAAGEWHYYHDGKSWLYKMVRKKQTLCWVGVHADTFRVTFYFGDRAEPLIERSPPPESIKEEFRTGKRFGRIRAVSMKVLTARDVDHALCLAGIKARV